MSESRRRVNRHRSESVRRERGANMAMGVASAMGTANLTAPVLMLSLGLAAWWSSAIAFGDEADARVEAMFEALPKRGPIAIPSGKRIVPLKVVGTLNPQGAGIENSGLVQSRQRPGVFWSLNDSGNAPRIFPVNRDATDVVPAGSAPAGQGVLIDNATNIDWEDLALDSQGNLVIGDVGNNQNGRQDLTLYIVPEPAPDAASVQATKEYLVRYPDQTRFPAPRTNFNFDCEAVFTVGDTIYLLTKHRSDLRTKLYRLDQPRTDAENVLTLIDQFQIQGQVTGADASADGKRLVVITYFAIWLFERDDLTTPFFDGRISYGQYLALQVEAVCFLDDQTLLLGDEKRGVLYEARLADLRRVR
jgi:hypothetical protein